MKTKEKYKPNIKQNNKLKPLKVSKIKSDDPMIRLRQMSQEREVYMTTDRTIKKRDVRYFARLGAKLAEESAKKIEKELEEENKNKQT